MMTVLSNPLLVVLLGVFGYFFVGFVFGLICRKINPWYYDTDLATMIMAFWPVAVPMEVIKAIYERVG